MTIHRSPNPEHPSMSRSARVTATRRAADARALLSQAIAAVTDPRLDRETRALALTLFLHDVNGDRGRKGDKDKSQQRPSTPSVSTQLSDQREADIGGMTRIDGLTQREVAEWLGMTEQRVGQLVGRSGVPALKADGGLSGRPRRDRDSGATVDPSDDVTETAAA